MQFEPAEVNFRALALKEDLAGVESDILNLIHYLIVDYNRDHLVPANTMNPRPLPRRTIHILLPAEAKNVFPLRVFLLPIQPSDYIVIRGELTILFPPGVTIGIAVVRDVGGPIRRMWHQGPHFVD